MSVFLCQDETLLIMPSLKGVGADIISYLFLFFSARVIMALVINDIARYRNVYSVSECKLEPDTKGQSNFKRARNARQVR